MLKKRKKNLRKIDFMNKKASTYSNSNTHKKFNLLIKNKLKVKMKPGSFKFQCTGEDLSNLGFISSLGGSNSNSDYLNIYTKSALFDYDTAKKIYDFCISKKDLGEITNYNLKKQKIHSSIGLLIAWILLMTIHLPQVI